MDATTTINSEAEKPWNGDHPSWADLFHGILTRPIVTLKQVDAALDVADSLAIYKFSTQTFNTVFLSAFILGLARITPTDIFSVVFDLISALTNEMLLWVLAAALLSMLSAVISDARPIKWKKALILTGWSFLPIIFYAPLLCFKNALGPIVLPLIAIPTWWSLFLLFASYKIALGINGKKLMVLILVVPPVIFLVYAFWTGFSFYMIFAEIIAAFVNK